MKCMFKTIILLPFLQALSHVNFSSNPNMLDIEKGLKNGNVKCQAVAASSLREFCSNTSVHGFRYFSEEKLHWIERFCWIISVILLIISCSFATVKIWSQWQNRPVIVSFDDKTTSVGTIPFPAITVCTTHQFDIRKMNAGKLIKKGYGTDNDGIKFNQNLTSKDINMLDAYLQLCLRDGTHYFAQSKTARSESIYKTIRKLAPRPNLTVLEATFHLMDVYFQPIFTEHGLCYTFNSLNSMNVYSDQVNPELLTVHHNTSEVDWSIENGYDEIQFGEAYPHRVFGTKSRDTLELTLGLFSNLNNYFCDDSSGKLMFSLHSPDELPRIPEDLILVQGGQEMYVSVNPNVIKTSTGLRSYSPVSRGCFFKTERNLRFFRFYNKHHCTLECLANYTVNQCGCTPFFLPGDNKTKVCTMIDYNCYEQADANFSKALVVTDCNCLPDCTSITYHAFLSQAALANRLVQIDQFNELVMKKNALPNPLSTLRILFKQSYFIAMTRSETSTMTDFMASCGGLLGLSMGISILSVVELIYYFTLRLFFKLKRQRANCISCVTWAK